MKLEMAVLYSNGGAEGYWETVVIDVPEAEPAMAYEQLDRIGRGHILTMEEYDDCVGCYLFSELVWSE